MQDNPVGLTGQGDERRKRGAIAALVLASGQFFIVNNAGVWGIVLGGVYESAGKGNKRGEFVANKPWVDKDQCISCGICKDNCPQVFRFDAHGKSECYNPEGAPEEVIQSTAIDLCPVSCIMWVVE